MISDDDFFPRPVSPPQRAIPVGPASGKSPGVQNSPSSVRDEVVAFGREHGAIAPAPDPTRSARAKRSWNTRRKNQHDRHVVGEHPFDAALEELYRQRDALNAGIEVLEKLKGAKP
jgi:hypothetical protein